MSILFGTQDDPLPPKRHKRARAAEPVTEEKRTFVPSGSAVQFSAAILGKMDDLVECPDDRCRAKCHDIVWKGRDKWMVECCFCGTGQMVDAQEEPVVEEQKVEVADEFRFPVGSRSQFIGMTMQEAADSPGGMPYIQWASQKSTSPAVRAACKIFLDANRATQ